MATMNAKTSNSPVIVIGTYIGRINYKLYKRYCTQTHHRVGDVPMSAWYVGAHVNNGEIVTSFGNPSTIPYDTSPAYQDAQQRVWALVSEANDIDERWRELTEAEDGTGDDIDDHEAEARLLFARMADICQEMPAAFFAEQAARRDTIIPSRDAYRAQVEPTYATFQDLQAIAEKASYEAQEAHKRHVLIMQGVEYFEQEAKRLGVDIEIEEMTVERPVGYVNSITEEMMATGERIDEQGAIARARRVKAAGGRKAKIKARDARPEIVPSLAFTNNDPTTWSLGEMYMAQGNEPVENTGQAYDRHSTGENS